MLVESALREQDQPAEDAVSAAVSSIHEQAKVDVQDYKYHFQYRLGSCFCRSYQTKVEHKLAQMPLELLEDLKADGGACFTCDYRSTKQDVTLQDLETAISNANKK